MLDCSLPLLVSVVGVSHTFWSFFLGFFILVLLGACFCHQSKIFGSPDYMTSCTSIPVFLCRGCPLPLLTGKFPLLAHSLGVSLVLTIDFLQSSMFILIFSFSLRIQACLPASTSLEMFSSTGSSCRNGDILGYVPFSFSLTCRSTSASIRFNTHTAGCSGCTEAFPLNGFAGFCCFLWVYLTLGIYN